MTTVLFDTEVGHQPRWRPGERLNQVFEATVDRLVARGDSGRVAVDGATTVTYAELDAAANRLGRLLQRRDIEPGDRVALLFRDPAAAYPALLATLKAQAGYVPLDAGFPPDRIDYILADAGVSLVLTDDAGQAALASASVPVLELGALAAELAGLPAERLPRPAAGRADDLAYIIYTSGTTGRPKGVAVSQSSIVNFVRVAAEVYGLREDDRMYQGLTLAFDFSVEEIWVSWAVGATLVPRPAGGSLLADDLHRFLVDARVTAMACVPTLLATLPEDLPRLRYLLVSGEACPADLVLRWWRPGRRFLNVYGPTETTVTATWCELHPDEPVTIGVPLPTYSALVLDPENQTVLDAGEVGELAIGGLGVAQGYVNRPDLTAAAFIREPLAVPNNPGRRVYRTGDLVRTLPDGRIEYLGRIDLQVKVRGYRIELAEIESVLMEAPGVAQAVVTTHDAGGVVELAGFVTARAGETVDLDRVLGHARSRLPGYMVPAYLDVLDRIPLLPSDKADRSRLPQPGARRGAPSSGVAPRTPAEEVIAKLLARTLAVPAVGATDHLFDDLAATSLLLARFCSTVRRTPGMPELSMREVYLHPSVDQLAARASALAPGTDWAAVADSLDTGSTDDSDQAQPQPTAAPAVTDRLRRRHALFGIAQAASLALAPLLVALVLAPSYSVLDAASGPLDLCLRGVGLAFAVLLASELLSVGGKWLLLGRVRPGSIPLWSLAHYRFWLAMRLEQLSILGWLAGSPLQAIHLRLCGARIGPGAVLLAPAPACPDLISLGAGAIVGRECALPGYRVEADRIRFGAVSVGVGAVVGDKCVLDVDTGVGAGARLASSSALRPGQAVPARARWEGNPGRPLEAPLPPLPALAPSRGRRARYAVGQLALYLVVAAALIVVAERLFEPLVLDGELPGPLSALDLTSPAGMLSFPFLAAAVLAGAAVLLAMHLLMALAATVLPRTLAPLVPQGRDFPLWGWRWSLHTLIRTLTNNPVHMKLFGDSSLILRYLGAVGWTLDRTGDTGSNFGQQQRHENPYGVSVGAGTMVSDGLSVFDTVISATAFRQEQVQIGAGCFLGNTIGWPAGARVGDDCLLGTKVALPVTGPVRAGVGLLGSPAFEIPRSVTRDRRTAVSDAERRRLLGLKLRHNLGTIGRFLSLGWFELTVFVIVARAASLVPAPAVVQTWLTLLVGALVGTAAAILAERAALGFGRLRPMSCALLDPRFWRHERFWKLSIEAQLKLLAGTTLRPTLLRLLGADVGECVFDDGCDFPERSLVRIGDGAVLNHGTSVQAHSLEDGLFCSERIELGAGVVLAPGAYVHFGTRIGDGARIETDSFLMKGEQVPAGAVWGGNPAQVVAGPVEPVDPAEPGAEVPAWAWTDAISVRGPVGADARVAMIDLESAGLGGRTQLAGLAAAGVPVELLDGADRQELAGLAPHRRVRTAVARVLLRLLLSERDADTPATQWRLARAASGRLRVAGPGRTAWVSVSYSAGLVAVAVGSVPIGVDVDTVPSTAVSALVGNPELFSAAERERLALVSPADLAETVGRAWTLKEAGSKADGSGALHALARIRPRTAGRGSADGVQVESWAPSARPVTHQWPVDLNGVRNWVSVVELPPMAG